MLSKSSVVAAAFALVPLSQALAGGHGLLHRLHQHHGCDNCEVHIHYGEAPSGAARQRYDEAAVSDNRTPLVYSPVVQSSPAVASPYMPMMQMPMMMPMMMPYPCQQPNASQNQSSGCGDCEPRIDRLEAGVKNLSERMDKIEEILINQNEVLKGIRAALPQPTPVGN